MDEGLEERDLGMSLRWAAAGRRDWKDRTSGKWRTQGVGSVVSYLRLLLQGT